MREFCLEIERRREKNQFDDTTPNWMSLKCAHLTGENTYMTGD